MNRRTFLQGSVAASMVAGLTPMASAAAAEKRYVSDSQFYELRRYRMASQEQREAVKAFYESAALPAMNRLGIKPIGVFERLEGGDDSDLFVVLPYSSPGKMLEIPWELSADQTFLDAADEYLNRSKENPPFERIESSLMAAFQGMPQLEVPTRKKEGKSRIFELRTYESYSELKGWRKVEMFNDGEIEIFRRTGLTPVFFGKTLIGPDLPNLTYMITFADKEERDQNWKKFINDPGWKELQSDDYYADTVSNITNTFLVPTSFSQL